MSFLLFKQLNNTNILRSIQFWASWSINELIDFAVVSLRPLIYFLFRLNVRLVYFLYLILLFTCMVITFIWVVSNFIYRDSCTRYTITILSKAIVRYLFFFFFFIEVQQISSNLLFLIIFPCLKVISVCFLKFKLDFQFLDWFAYLQLEMQFWVPVLWFDIQMCILTCTCRIMSRAILIKLLCKILLGA